MELYAKFHNRGFVIVSVSIDEDREKFEKALKNAGFTWRQVFDGQATKSPLVELFNARGVPISYLVGPDGKLAAKIVNGNQLQQQVTKLMENGR